MTAHYLKATVLSLSFAFAAGAAQAEDWVCSGYMPSVQHPSIVNLQAIADEVKKLSGDQVEMTCRTGGELSIAPAELTTAVADGLVQLGASPFITGTVPITGLFALPGLFRTEEDVQKGLSIAEPYFGAEFAKKGLVYLGTYHYPRQVLFSTGEIDDLGDIKGKKYRISSGEQAEFITRFGGTPVTIATPDVPQALQMGTIDGVLTASSGGARYWTETLKSNYDIGTNYTLAVIFMNEDAFDTLGEDGQKSLRDFVQARLQPTTKVIADENVTFREQFRKDGMKITEASEADEALIVSTLESYWPQWAKERGPEAEKLLGEIRAALGR